MLSFMISLSNSLALIILTIDREKGRRGALFSSQLRMMICAILRHGVSLLHCRRRCCRHCRRGL